VRKREEGGRDGRREGKKEVGREEGRKEDKGEAGIIYFICTNVDLQDTYGKRVFWYT